MDIGWKLVSAGAGVISGIVANKAADALWKFASGKRRPDTDDPTEPLRDVVVFAVVSASVGAIVNQLVMRRAATWYGFGERVRESLATASE